MTTVAALLFLFPAIQEPILDPTSWPSRSEVFVLEVQPHRRNGVGPADYQLKERGTKVWSGDRPFTLWQAAVTDAGTVLGYAYTEGIHSPKGELQLIRIGIDGKASVCGAKPRRSSEVVAGGPAPTGLDIVLEEVSDRAIIGVQDDSHWYVRISTGELLPKFRPVKPWMSRARPRSRYLSPPSTLVDLEILGTFSFGGERSDPLPGVPRKRTFVSEIVVDLAGRIYAVESDSSVIHVFDSDGRPLRTCRPEPSDFSPDLPRMSLAVGPDGSVYANDQDKRRTAEGLIRFLVFGPDGTRRGWESFGFAGLTQRCQFKPEGGERWVAGGGELFLVDADGRLRRRIDRQPDGRWIPEIAGLAVAPDGSVALLTTSGLMQADAEYAIHLYDGDGAEMRSFDVPKDVHHWAPGLVWTGRWIVVARRGGRFLLIDTKAARRFDYVPPWIGADSAALDLFLAGQGRELWFVDLQARIVRRVSLPSD